ncbi:MAG TPA: adenylyltransferase [Elusimicrobia bacterium]|nr:adenylyltransferase [Elusimicrobiota bacterium]
MSPLNDAEKTRYDRQILLPGWGEDGQEKLKNSTVFISGAGGLGSPVSLYLAAAGVGRIRICDDGDLELSNLNRQILHSDAGIGKKKVLSAQERLKAVNPSVEVVPLQARIEAANVAELVGDAAILLDCLDNYATRHVLNEHSVKTGVPLVLGAVHGLCGQLSFLHPPETPCLRCVFPHIPAQKVFPVIGATPGVVGALQAMEALKFLTGIGEPLAGRLLIFEGETMEFRQVLVKKDPACPVCGKPTRP